MPADTPELCEAALRLRYQVYCGDPFEKPAEHPDGVATERLSASSGRR